MEPDSPTPNAAIAPAKNPALAQQAAILARPGSEARRMADCIRALAIDAVEAAKSGHPGMPTTWALPVCVPRCALRPSCG
ncbi:MAG: hypothetical protein V4653_07755, partial [Pseudomonadota bacterium]